MTTLGRIGFGTYRLKGETLRDALTHAFAVGYRSIDTAQVYKNEADVGAFLQSQFDAGGITRTDVFITTKIAPANQGTEKAHDSILESLRKLNLEYIDLVLIHWPGSSGLKPHDTQNIVRRKQTWEALERLTTTPIALEANGEERVRVKAIGVSNYEEKHILELLEYAVVKPAVNQVELHPLYGYKELRKVCGENGIQVQAYSSLGEGNLVRREYLENTVSDTGNRLADVVDDVLGRYPGMTVAQLMLRWALQHEIAVIPKSSNVERIKENWGAGIGLVWGESEKEDKGFQLSEKDMDILDKLTTTGGFLPVKFCWNPDKVA